MAWQIVSNGVAIVVAQGPIAGGFVTNPANYEAQGLSVAENAYIDLVNVPGSTDAAGNNTTSILYPGDSFPLPALASGVLVRVNAASAGHKFVVQVDR